MELELRDGIARVDDEDAERVAGFRWRSTRTSPARVYAYTKISGRRVWMHHFILNVAPQPRGKGDIDHINGDGLDNRRGNLRQATRRQNNANSRPRGGTSKFKGVSWNRKQGVWQVHISAHGKSEYLGVYELETDAARAYDLAAVAAFGEFARINFPDRLHEPAPTRFSLLARGRVLGQVATEIQRSGDHRQGETNPRAKLTEADVRRIIHELQIVPRRSQEDIARQFGVSRGLISQIRMRRIWTHLWDDE